MKILGIPMCFVKWLRLTKQIEIPRIAKRCEFEMVFMTLFFGTFVAVSGKREYWGSKLSASVGEP